MTTTVDLRALRHCRMVLCLPDDDGLLSARLAEHGVPGVPWPAAARSARRLRHFRHRFDGVVCDFGALAAASVPELLVGLHEALLPGGRLLCVGTAPPREDLVAAGWLPSARGDHWHTPRAAVRQAPPMLRVGPYADLLVGCRRVLELGCGAGGFLDALRLRGIACQGIEAEPGLVQRARERGHEVTVGGLQALQGMAVDGLFVDHGLDALAATAIAGVLAACRHVLPAAGRLVVRCPQRDRARLRACFDAAHWGPVYDSQVPGDDDDGFVVALATGDTPAWPHAAAATTVLTHNPAWQQPPRSFYDLERAERQVTSQGGEDGVLAELFARLGTTNRHYVEFGCGDGLQCNTTQLRRAGWQGLLMDGVAAPAADDAVIHAAWITAANIEQLLDHHGVPDEPDLLSIDVDGNDYWIWRAITRRPRVVVVEYNANLPADRAVTIPYDPAHRWDGSDFYGASLLALAQLGRAKGYTLVYCTQAGVNAFFVRDDLLAGLAAVDARSLYRPPNYWYRGARSRPDLSRAMLSV